MSPEHALIALIVSILALGLLAFAGLGYLITWALAQIFDRTMCDRIPQRLQMDEPDED